VEAKTATDAEGKYRFADIAPGDYRIRAEHTGFPTVSRDFTVPAGVATIQLPIVLTRAQDSKPTSTAQGASTFRSGIGAGVAAGGAAAAPPPAALLPPPSAQAAAGSGRGGGGGAMASPTQRDYVPQPNSWSGYTPYTPPASGESYAHIDANRFQNVRDNPLSTFGADVDTASYSNVRRFLSAGQLPPRDAVRIEELVNYFHFNYADPHDGRPIALTTEVGDCPWAPSHTLVLIGARAKASTPLDVEGRNIVLLIDVSGSMAPPERLPLIKTALGMFVDTLRPDDRLAIVTYAGTSGVALASTPVRSRDVIQRAIANLNAGGSTNGGEGLIMAYRVASENFIPGGINRVILFTDGDFNVGIVNQSDLVRLIEREKTTGVFLSVFGVGTGNLKDSMMEMLADKGNGHYAYLDSLQEARRVLVREADATLETVAKDVKFQVEFNPATVTAWKQIGYEDRALAARDFNNDRKDGGEMGAGHTVTVLYEVVPVGAAYSDGDDGGTGRPGVDPLKYQPQSQSQQATVRPDIIEGSHSGEWLTVKARYKMPEGDASELIMQAVRPGGRVQHLPLASAVAEFGLLLRDDRHDIERWDALARRVKQLHVPSSLGSDKDAFAELVEIARGLVRLR
jgi:Ca-activated chloride channel family protein